MELDNTTLAFLKYKNGIGKFCRLYHRNVGMEVADLESEMYAVLHKCVESYDPDKGATFNTLMWNAIYNRFRTIIRYNGAGKRAGHEILVDMQFDQSSVEGDMSTSDYAQLGISKAVEALTAEASTEDAYLALELVRERMKSPTSRRRMISSRQFSHAS